MEVDPPQFGLGVQNVGPFPLKGKMSIFIDQGQFPPHLLTL